MKKSKILTPLLSIAAMGGLVLPIASCACSQEDSAIKESIDFKKEQSIDTQARYIFILDKDTYEKKDVTVDLSGEGKDKFIVSYNISNNMLIIEVTPIELPLDAQETYTFHLKVKVGSHTKEYNDIVIHVLPLPEVPTVNEHLKYRYNEDSQTYYAYCDLAEEDRPSWDVRMLCFDTTYNDGEHGVKAITGVESNGFKNCTSIQKLVIPENITYIGQNAFASCDYNETPETYKCKGEIKTIKFLGTSKLETIDDYAFRGQNKLTEITIPKSVKTLGMLCFYCLDKDENCGKCVGSLEKVIFEEGSILETIGWSCFVGHKGIKSIDIPNSVVSISYYAFDCCDYVVEDGVYTYTPCGNISTFNIDINNSKLESLGYASFMGQKELTSINIPQNCHAIGEYYDYASNPFILCPKLKTFNVHSSNTSVKTNTAKDILFAYSDLVTPSNMSLISYPTASGDVDLSSYNDTKFIGNNLFIHNPNITSVKLSNEVTNILSDAFSDCKNLTKIELGKNVSNIDHTAFLYSSNLVDFEVDSNNQYFKSLTVGENKPLLLSYNENVSQWGLSSYPSAKGEVDFTDSVFNEIEALWSFCFQETPITSFKANQNLKAIWNETFVWCSKLKSVNLNMIESLERGAFYGCNIQKIEVNPNNTKFKTENDGKILIDNNSTLELYLDGNGKNVDFSTGALSSIKNIDYTAFSNYSLGSIKLISLGTIERINNTTFRGLTFDNTNITIPTTTTFIGRLAFSETKGLETITFADTNNWICKGAGIDVTTPKTNLDNLTNQKHDWCTQGISKSA